MNLSLATISWAQSIDPSESNAFFIDGHLIPDDATETREAATTLANARATAVRRSLLESGWVSKAERGMTALIPAISPDSGIAASVLLSLPLPLPDDLGTVIDQVAKTALAAGYRLDCATLQPALAAQRWTLWDSLFETTRQLVLRVQELTDRLMNAVRERLT